MIGAVQTFGGLIHFHPHIHAIVCEGVFTGSGHFVSIPDIRQHRADEIFREHVLEFLIDQHKISEEPAGQMRPRKYSGFGVYNSVRIERGNTEGMARVENCLQAFFFSIP